MAQPNVLTWGRPGQLVIRSSDSLLGSDLGSSRLLSCSTVPQNLTSGRHSERLTPKSLILEVIGLGRMGPIFMAASCSQDVTRPIHQDPTRGSPRGYCDDRSDYARTMRPSARRPPEPRPGLHSARPQSTVCGRAQRSRSGGSARVHCRRGRGTNGSRCSLADVAAITRRALSWYCADADYPLWKCLALGRPCRSAMVLARAPHRLPTGGGCRSFGRGPRGKGLRRSPDRCP